MTIRVATLEARKSIFYRARVGAVVSRSGRVLSRGHNFIGNTRYVDRPYKESTHAEVSAISKLLKENRAHELVASVLFVSRIGRNGNCRMAAPCGNCAALIRSVGIKRVVYTVDANQVMKETIRNGHEGA